METKETPKETPIVIQNPMVDGSDLSNDFIGAALKAAETGEELVVPEGEKPIVEAQEPVTTEIKEEKPVIKEKKTKKEEIETKPDEIVEKPTTKRREHFKELADKERIYRERESQLKDREKAADEALSWRKKFDSDPIAALEAKDPQAFEKMVHRWAENEGKATGGEENAGLRKEISELREAIKQNQLSVSQHAGQAEYSQYMRDATKILDDKEYEPIKQYAELAEDFGGQPVNVEQALAAVYTEYFQGYNKQLTPRECCEILLEDAQEHLARLPQSKRLRAFYGLEETEKIAPKKPTKLKERTAPTEQSNTLTSQMATSSESADPTQDWMGLTEDEIVRKAANMVRWDGND